MGCSFFARDKRDGSLGLFVNYGELTAVMIYNLYRHPHIDECVDMKGELTFRKMSSAIMCLV